MTTIYDDEEKVFLPLHTSKHQYYAQWCFDHGSIVTERHLGMTSYTILYGYEPRPFDAAFTEVSAILDCLS